MIKLGIVGSVLLVGSMVAVSQLVLRHGMRQLGQQQLTFSLQTIWMLAANPSILTSLVLGLATFAVYAHLLTKVDVTFAAPAANAVFYLAIFVIGAIWLHERITLMRAGGAMVLLVAMWLLTREVGQ